jgi:hypothetical protein
MHDKSQDAQLDLQYAPLQMQGEADSAFWTLPDASEALGLPLGFS